MNKVFFLIVHYILLVLIMHHDYFLLDLLFPCISHPASHLILLPDISQHIVT